MDDIVHRAMAKWPNVPNYLGWLVLDQRGQQHVHNEYVQANKLSGEPVRHTTPIGFIVRSYAHDDAGRQFFRNGPQRMFVELDYIPWVTRLSVDGVPRVFTTATGVAFSPSGCFLNEQGNVLFSGYVGGFEAEGTVAMLHDYGLEPFSSSADQHTEACGAALGILTRGDRTSDIEPIARAEVAKHCDFVIRPTE